MLSVVRLLEHSIGPPAACAYLPGRQWTMENKVMLGIGSAELQALLEQGWRRFGPVYFRPVCAGCTECVPLRVPVAGFAPSANLRRVLKRADGLRIEVASPSVDEARVSLHRRWHECRVEQRGWEAQPDDEESYALHFCFPHPSALEVTYWDGQRLLAVGLTDRTPDALSAVYCFHDPDRAALSLGTLNVLTTISLARDWKLAHVYLGYCVEACDSLRYKRRFRPQERLVDPRGGDPRWEQVQ